MLNFVVFKTKMTWIWSTECQLALFNVTAGHPNLALFFNYLVILNIFGRECLKKSKLGNSRTLCLALSRGSSLQIRFCVISLFEGKWSNFFYHRYLGNDKKIIEIGKLLIIIWFLFYLFFDFIRNWFISAETLYSSLRLVCLRNVEYIWP